MSAKSSKRTSTSRCEGCGGPDPRRLGFNGKWAWFCTGCQEIACAYPGCGHQQAGADDAEDGAAVGAGHRSGGGGHRARSLALCGGSPQPGRVLSGTLTRVPDPPMIRRFAIRPFEEDAL